MKTGDAISLSTYWRLIRELTLSQMKARYRRTFAGFIWVLMSPIIMFSAQALVFRHILNIAVPNYWIFLLGGLLPWIFIITSLEMGIPVLTSSRQLLIAFKVDPAILMGASILDNWLNFLAAFLVILLPAVLLTGSFTPGLLFLPLAMLILLAGVAGLVSFLGILNVFYRDVRFIVHFLVGVLFFLTPVFYPRDLVPREMQWLVSLNPAYHLLQVVRECIYEFDPKRFVMAGLNASVIAVGSMAMAVAYWKRRKNEFYHYI